MSDPNHELRRKVLAGSKSQSALEYMMTYGWAILIIVIVAGVLYAMGIFSPSSSASTTVTGFSGLGSVTAQCYANGLLRIQLGNSIGNTINITGISATSNSETVSFTGTSTVDSAPEIAPDGTYIFSLQNICPSASSKFSISVNVNYTEPGRMFSGPYSSTGTLYGTVSSTSLPVYVASFDNYVHYQYTWGGSQWYYHHDLSYINVTQSISGTNATYTVTMWVQSSAQYNTNPPTPNSSSIGGSWEPLSGFEGAIDSQNIGSATGALALHRCSSADNSGFGPSNPVTPTFFDGNWHFVAFSVSPTLYIGMVDGKSGSAAGVHQYSDTAGFFIGGYQWCFPKPFKGDIVNVQLYNVALSSAQLTQIYDAGILGEPILNNGNGLVGWWPMNSTVGGKVKDYSGNGFNGQLNNVSITSNYISGAIGN